MKTKKLKKVEIDKLNEAHQKVLYWFFSFPHLEIGLNDLSSRLKISKTTAKKVVNSLVSKGFLNKKVYGNTWSIGCSYDHIYNRTKKIAFNLSMVYNAYHNDLEEKIKNLVGNAKATILFGSYRKGDDIEKSDIDLAVEVADDEDIRIVELGVIPQFGFRKDVRVNLHIFSRKNVDINLFANIANGILLDGFLEVHP